MRLDEAVRDAIAECDLIASELETHALGAPIWAVAQQWVKSLRAVADNLEASWDNPTRQDERSTT